MSASTYLHWSLNRSPDGGAELVIDVADSSANVLSQAVLSELDKLLEQLEEEESPAYLLIRSGKKAGFIAGADISAFATLTDAKRALPLIEQGQRVFDRLEGLPFPTVAVIDGYCLGGGLELAMSCMHRVASSEPHTRLGVPEVRLGIHPGFGGTVRLPGLVGDLAALDLMLSGRLVGGKAAQQMGLVDFSVPARQLMRAAKALVAGGHPIKHAGFLRRLPGNILLRPLVAAFLHRKVAGISPEEHYPAPYAIIDLWRRHVGDPLRMFAHEAASVAQLMTSPASRHLVRVFSLRERMNALGRGARCHDVGENGHVHVVGAGVMGGDIAAWCAFKGFTVTLSDTRPQGIGAALVRARGLYQGKLKKDHLVQAAMDRLIPDLAGHGVAKADVVIEAIVEETNAKRALYAQLEPRMKPGAILATNTSSIPLEELSAGLSDPSRLVGLHFFNPVAKMPLVEVVRGQQTPDEVMDRMFAFAKRIERLPLPVKSAPGFLVNRLLMPYLLEAVLMAAEGVAVEEIDRAARGFGMPMGPLELADTVGLDICLSVAEHLSPGDDPPVPISLRELVALGQLGCKSGRGFYRYQGRKRTPIRRHGRLKPVPDDIIDRLILPLVNEGMAALREGVVEDADMLDAGMIFGTGFAPFRGGPMGHASAVGIRQLARRLETLKGVHGARFQPDIGWSNPVICRQISVLEVCHGTDETGRHPPPDGSHVAGALPGAR